MDDATKSEEFVNGPILQRGRLLYGSGVIAMATLFGYILTHRHESGYVARFGIPEQAVDVTLVAVLSCVTSLIFAFYFIGATINWILTRDFVKKHRVGLGLFVRLVGYSFVLLFFSALVSLPAKQSLPYLLAVSGIGLVVIEIVLPIRRQPLVNGWINKIDAYRREERRRIRESKVMDVLERIFGFEMTLIFAVGMLLCWPAPIIGSMNATSQRNFAVAKIDGKSYALIRRYDDHYLFERLGHDEKGNYLCAQVLTMTSSELAAGRVIMQKVAMDPPRMISRCE